ncbi:10374_t:CDS:2 [Rhizophagus irregularis]|nr:10374_t:CDS:2 [Rhizophagus irregularis]
MHLETTMIISTESPQQLQFGISSSKDGLLAIHNAEKFMLRTEYLVQIKILLIFAFPSLHLKKKERKATGPGIFRNTGVIGRMTLRMYVSMESNSLGHHHHESLTYYPILLLSNMTSELELLRQKVVELMAENAEI